jgi:hypothetical protein
MLTESMTYSPWLKNQVRYQKTCLGQPANELYQKAI